MGAESEERIHRPAAAAPVSEHAPASVSLEVGPADDRYEREAHRVAAEVVQRLRSGAAGDGDPTADTHDDGQREDSAVAAARVQRVQRVSASPAGAAGGAVPDGIASRIDAARRTGGRPLDAVAQRSMEGAFGADFGRVRVHAGSDSAQLNDRLGAEAFTIGSDVFFRGGVPDHSDAAGGQLLAHELTHVLQQDGGSASAQRVQRSIATFGGSFDTTQYEATYGTPADGKQAVGGVIDLAFTPNALVDGKVGLVQTGNANRGGVVDIQKGDAGKNARAQKSGDLDEGRFLDRSNRKENPVFGMENSKAELSPMADAEGISMTKDAVGAPAEQRNRDAREGATVVKADPSAVVDAAKVSTQAGQIGWNDSVKGVQAATLRDEPGRHHAWDAAKRTGEEIAMTFETAALGLSGPIEGAYLGSVEWGFIAPADSPTAKPLPFKMVSRGVPSAAFMLSAKLWNDNGAMDMGGKTTRLNMPVALTTHRTDPAIDALLDDPGTPAETLRSALTARIALLQSQIPADIGTRITALSAVVIEDREAADEYQEALDALNLQYTAFTKQVADTAAAKRKAQGDLTAAQEGLAALDRALNAITRRVGDGKRKLTAAKADVAAKQRTLDADTATANDAGRSLDAVGPKINAAKTDPNFRVALAKYRDDLIVVQNLMSDARSRQLEIGALQVELAKIPPKTT